MLKPTDTFHSDPWHYARPDLADAYLHAFDLKLSAARGLFARRRMGKTEFLQKDLIPAARDRGYLVAYTNLWDNRAAPDVALIASLSAACESRGVKGLFAGFGKPVRNIKAGASIPGGFSGTLETELVSMDDMRALPEALKQLDKQKKPLLLVIDEAQVLARVEHSDFAHALRAALDIRKDRIKVIFAGSSETTLREMFARASEPFYNWAALEPFDLLNDDFVDFTIQHMNGMVRHPLTLQQGLHAFNTLHRTPEFFKRFIERYVLYQANGPEDALRHTMASVFSDAHFLKQWQALKAADRAIILLIAHGQTDLHSAASLATLTAALGTIVTKNTVAHALRRMMSENAVTRLSLGDYRLEDEAFGEWLRRKAPNAHLR